MIQGKKYKYFYFKHRTKGRKKYCGLEMWIVCQTQKIMSKCVIEKIDKKKIKWPKIVVEEECLRKGDRCMTEDYC